MSPLAARQSPGTVLTAMGVRGIFTSAMKLDDVVAAVAHVLR